MTRTVKRIMLPVDQETLDALTKLSEVTNQSLAATGSEVLRESIPMMNSLVEALRISKSDPQSAAAILKRFTEEQLSMFEAGK